MPILKAALARGTPLARRLSRAVRPASVVVTCRAEHHTQRALSSKYQRTRHAAKAVTPLGVTSSNQRHRSYSTSSSSSIYTASFAFFEAIWEAGITHCFVNLGSDHPSIIEAMVKGQREAKGKFPRIITCPNEVGLLLKRS